MTRHAPDQSCSEDPPGLLFLVVVAVLVQPLAADMLTSSLAIEPQCTETTEPRYNENNNSGWTYEPVIRCQASPQNQPETEERKKTDKKD